MKKLRLLVSGAFYNSSNTVVASDFTFTDPQDLEPGQKTPFDITVSAPMANEITSASVDVDSVQYSSVIQNETNRGLGRDLYDR
jgi:hypothetical protein